MGIFQGVLRGTAAGAAGTMGLNAVTYMDMAGRGRSSSSAPEETVERLVGASPFEVPGDGDTRTNRVTALGSLNGTFVGVGVGAALGGDRAQGDRSPAVDPRGLGQ